MEFPFDINDIFPGDNSICVVLPSLSVTNLEKSKERNSRLNQPQLLKESQINILEVINKLGEASAKAQGLQSSITTGQKLTISDHTLYIKKGSSNGNGCLFGILKIGPKRLFVIDQNDKLHESNPLCVLDFYIHESQQRKGYGKELFDAMLKEEKLLPQHLAIDRPSEKFVAFLQKHYNLTDKIKQTNNFVVFKEFFEGNIFLDKKSPSQRHSYAGIDQFRSTPNQRPHSLGIESCFMWNGTTVNESPILEDITTTNKSRCSFKSEPSSTSQDESIKQNRSSSSWNVFGVLPPDYRNYEESNPITMYQDVKTCNASRR